jgi:hypothetical protein
MTYLKEKMAHITMAGIQIDDIPARTKNHTLLTTSILFLSFFHPSSGETNQILSKVSLQD